MRWQRSQAYVLINPEGLWNILLQHQAKPASIPWLETLRVNKLRTSSSSDNSDSAKNQLVAWNIKLYLESSEPSNNCSESFLILSIKSRLNLAPEKLHSEGNANKLYA